MSCGVAKMAAMSVSALAKRGESGIMGRVTYICNPIIHYA